MTQVHRFTSNIHIHTYQSGAWVSNF